ncbi:hypothetical protein [Actinocrispum wychmicini]|uniref:Uncharacterized protein n=1 Tax=Actinocrispum wychmicini TaxID=1213861 RepID=A0A4R2JZV1_9PSEU|nr:hypothetical protein [Actinocrispum wychmicini]TCO65534.1 hypothetical protein EV192_1011326 [Actinocrispum wychmicini]
MIDLLGLLLAPAQRPAHVPRLDVPAAIKVLETQQVYQAPGVVVNIDMAKVSAELSADTKVLIAPFTEPFKDGNNYPKYDDHLNQVHQPLKAWADSRKVRLITVEGLSTSYGPADLTELREIAAYMDITGPVLSAARNAKGVPVGDTVPHYQVVAPTAAQLADMAGKLRQDPVYNAPGRDDKFPAESWQLVKDKTGFTMRVAALPPLKPGEPFVDYAPALAKEFPDDIVLVAQGYWVEIAGKDQELLSSARNYASGRYEMGTFQQGGTIDGRVGSIMLRFHDLSRRKPFGRPQPQTYDPQTTITKYTPWAWGASALVLGGGALAGFGLRRRRQHQVERAAMHKAKAEAYAKISELGTALLDHQTPEAAERYSTARDMFEQAETAVAMAEVERIADEGLELL